MINKIAFQLTLSYNLTPMALSIFLAKIFGAAYLAVGLGMLFNKKHYHKMFKDMMSNEVIYLFGGMLSLALGLVLILHHNCWVKDWTVIITLFGWIALLKGILLLVFPKIMPKLAKPFVKNEQNLMAWGLLVLVLGAVLGYFGFLA